MSYNPKSVLQAMNRYLEYILQKPYQRIFILFISFLLVYMIILYLTVGLHQPLWGDERHFVQTIEQFGQKFSLEQLKTYNEMSTPLPFILYAIWGKLVGFDLQLLRLFSLIIAFLTFNTFFILFYKSSKRADIALLVTLFLIFQPYNIGITIFVFTDMLPLFFLALTLVAFQLERPFLLLISIAGALLCRQYFIFLPAALSGYYLIQITTIKSKNSSKMLLASIFSVIPIIPLIILWGGFSPDNEMRQLYLQKGFQFHPDFLILYISLFMVYLFPLILYRWKRYYFNRKILLLALPISFIYFLFPIKASEYAMAINVFTVGFFHKFIRMILSSSLEHVIFYFAFLLSLPVLIVVIQDIYIKIKCRIVNGILLADFSIIFFLIIMPFSYLNWEKYFLPIIPLATIQILCENVFKYFGNSLSPGDDCRE